MPENTNRPTRHRRFLTGAAVLSIAAAGAAWSGCGDSDEEEAVDAANEALENANEATDQALEQAEEQSEEIQGEVEEATDQALEEADEATDQSLEDAPKP